MLREATAGLQRRLGVDHPMALGVQRNLGGALSRSGALDEAITILEQVVAIDRGRLGGRHFELGISLDYLGGMYDQARRFPAAEQAFRGNYEVFREMVGPGHFNTALALGRYAWARCRPGVELEAGRTRAALLDFESALAIIDSVMPLANNQRIGRHAMYGTCLSRAGRTAEGETELLLQLELARGAFPSGDQTLRFVVGELTGHFIRTGNSERQTWIRALGDSLGVPPPSP